MNIQYKDKLVYLLALLLGLLILALLALATIRIDQDERGVWTGQTPGIEVIYLPDRPARRCGFICGAAWYGR